MDAQSTIRRLTPDDAALYREIRLEGLRLCPAAFSADFDAENAQPLSWFADRLGHSMVFGAFSNPALLGVAGFFRQPGSKRAHKALVVGVYVRPSARRLGVARLLMEKVIGEAGTSVDALLLSVEKDNEPARRLYAALGFVEYGIEKNALNIDGRSYDEILMTKLLR